MKKVTIQNLNTVFYGTNNYRNSKHGSCHAEIDSLNKFSGYRKYNLKIKKFDLISIRIGNSGKLQNAKPCIHCLIKLIKKCGNKIRNIYYSNSEGEIICSNLKELLKTENYISRGNRKK